MKATESMWADPNSPADPSYAPERLPPEPYIYADTPRRHRRAGRLAGIILGIVFWGIALLVLDILVLIFAPIPVHNLLAFDAMMVGMFVLVGAIVGPR